MLAWFMGPKATNFIVWTFHRALFHETTSTCRAREKVENNCLQCSTSESALAALASARASRLQPQLGANKPVEEFDENVEAGRTLRP
jgi:hypothetical protein